MPFIVDDGNDSFGESVQTIQRTQQTLKSNIPAGYLPITLSTKGKLGVPELIHVRNFSTENLIDLSMATEELLPERLIHLLKDLIYEDVKVEEWPEQAIVELLIKLYANFFTPMINSATFPWNKSDIEWLEKNNREKEARDIEAGTYQPKIDIDLRKVKIKDFPSNIKSYVVIKNKKAITDPDYVEAKFFSYVRLGDSIALRKAVTEKYESEDRKFDKIRQLTNLRSSLIAQGETSGLPVIPEKEYLAWQMHELSKAIYLSKISKALYLVSFNGIDLSNASLEEKLRYAQDPRLDINITKKLDAQFGKLDFGVDPNLEVKNPITGEICTRRFSFRLMDILQALQSSESDEYDISYDD